MLKHILLLTVAGAAVACSAPKEEPVSTGLSTPPKITRVALLTDEAGQPGTEVTAFDYHQKTLHFLVALDHPVPKTKARWVFTAKSTSAGDNRPMNSVEGSVEGQAIKGQISLDTPWPVGTYHVDVWLGESSVGNFDYEVVGKQTPIVFGHQTLSVEDGKGGPARAVDHFSVKDHTIHIEVSTRGVDNTGPTVVWRLLRVTGEKEVEIGNVQQPQMKLQDSFLRAQFTSPGDWTAGTYHAVIEINGNKAHTIGFLIR